MGVTTSQTRMPTWILLALYLVLSGGVGLAQTGTPKIDAEERSALTAELAELRARFLRLKGAKRAQAMVRIKEIRGLLEAKPESPKTILKVDPALLGIQKFVFKEKHPKGDIAGVAKRLGWTESFMKQHDEDLGYDLKTESFSGYVPKLPKGRTAYRVLVWISPVDHPYMDKTWVPVLDKLGFIIVQANGCGNERFNWYRMALALDALHGIESTYPVDPDAVFIAGFSGGGRCAASTAFHFSDLFKGGYYQGGMNYYLDVHLPGPEGAVIARRIPKPRAAYLRRTLSESRHVVETGEKCFNRKTSKPIADSMKKRGGFKSVLWQESPGHGHQPPNAETFEAGLRYLLGEEPSTKNSK